VVNSRLKLKYYIFSTFIIILTVFLLNIFSTVSADTPQDYNVPYNSYVYNFWEEPVPAPQAYVPDRIITGQELEIDSFSSPRDLHVNREKQQIYIADTGNNRIIIFDEKWQKVNIITQFNTEEGQDEFDDPRGIYTTSDGRIYVADRGNNRILIFSKEGEYLDKVGRPEADEFEFRDYRFLPSKVAVDQHGMMYVVADEIYEGMLEFDMDGYFTGFIGAPEVQVDFFQYIWRRFSPQERRERLSLFLPTEFSNLEIDERGLILTTVSGGAVDEEDYVRRLNPAGEDTLYRDGFTAPMGDYGTSLQDAGGEYIYQGSLFVDIIPRPNNAYSVLDQRRGRIFTYNRRGHLLYVFGFRGDQRGGFRTPRAVEAIGNKILVLDSRKENITIFEPTEYSQLIHQAEEYYTEGRFNRAVDKWEQVLDLNANYDLAYTGIGRGKLYQNNFAEAMKNFRLGQNRSEYSRAFEFYRHEVIRKNLSIVGYIFLFIFLISVIGFKYYSKFGEYYIQLKDKNRHIIFDLFQMKNYRIFQKLYYYIIDTMKSLIFGLKVIVHPFGGFWELKSENKANYLASTINLIILIATFIFMRQYTGFIFNTRNLEELNILVELASIAVPFFLWCTVNWALTTLMEGKGTFGEIYKTTAYAMLPFILINIPLTVVSNYLLLEEYMIYFLLFSLALVWSFVLLFCGTLTIHQYSLSKMFLVTVFILLGITIVIFLGLLFFNLLEQVYAFFLTIYRELTYRI